MSIPLISIIIATFNSERTLEFTLKLLNQQSIPKNQREIIVVDGGSKDGTLKIAKTYKCRIIKNPMTEPLSAKYLGFLRARGRYIIGLDHDEVFGDTTSLERRLAVFKCDSRVKALHSSGYITPGNASFINSYVNEFGDPFSFFIYNLTKDYRFFTTVLKKRYTVIYEDENYFLIKISKDQGRAPLMEVLAGGCMVDRNYVVKKLKRLIPNKELFLPHLHLHLLTLNPYIAVMKGDPLYHNSAESLPKYLKKLEWRVRNNIYFSRSSGAAGYLQREQLEEKSSDMKKFLFIPYSMSVVWPLVDAVWLCMTRHTMSYLIHVPLSIITIVFILYHYLRKALGFYPVLTSYDGSTKITKTWH